MNVLSLNQYDAFEHLTEDELERLLAGAQATTLADGDELFDETEDSDGTVWVVVSGAVQVYKVTQFGDFEFATLGPGELVGEVSFLDQLERSAAARAVGETELLVLNPGVLRPVLQADLKLNLALHWLLWKSISKKLRSSNALISSFFDTGSQPPPSSRFEASDPREAYSVPMTDKRKIFEEQKLSSMEINFLSSLSKARKLDVGEVIFREGDSGAEMFVVVDGSVRISKRIPGVGEEALTVLERGEYFGEMALFDDLPRSADAKANAPDTVVLTISNDVLSGILNVNKVSSLRLLSNLCSMLAQRLRQSDEKLITWFMLAGGQQPGRA